MFGWNGCDTKSSAGTDNFGFNITSMCGCTAGEHEGHSFIFTLHHNCNIVSVIPFTVLLELKTTSNAPDLLRFTFSYPADQINVMYAPVSYTHLTLPTIYSV